MRYRFQNREQIYDVEIERQGDTFRANINGQSFDVETLDSQLGQLSLRFVEKSLTLYWAADGGQKWVSLNGCTYLLEKPAARTARHTGDPAEGESVRAPMPAQVRAVQVAEGDLVEKGQTLILLEAMKMEIRIKAPSDGHIKRLAVSSGQAVEKDQILAEIGA